MLKFKSNHIIMKITNKFIIRDLPTKSVLKLPVKSMNSNLLKVIIIWIIKIWKLLSLSKNTLGGKKSGNLKKSWYRRWVIYWGWMRYSNPVLVLISALLSIVYYTEQIILIILNLKEWSIISFKKNPEQISVYTGVCYFIKFKYNRTFN